MTCIVLPNDNLLHSKAQQSSRISHFDLVAISAMICDMRSQFIYLALHSPICVCVYVSNGVRFGIRNVSLEFHAQDLHKM